MVSVLPVVSRKLDVLRRSGLIRPADLGHPERDVRIALDQRAKLVKLFEIVAVIGSGSDILAGLRIVEDYRIVCQRVRPVRSFAQLQSGFDSGFGEQRADMILQQVADLRIGNLGVNAGLVEQADVVDAHALLFVFLDIAQIVQRQGIEVLAIDILVLRQVHKHPVRWIIHGRLQHELAVSLRRFDVRDQAVWRKVASDREVLHGHVAGRVVIGVPAARSLEIGGRNRGLHRGKARARGGIEERGKQGVLLWFVQAANAHHPGFQECRAKAVDSLQAELVVDTKCRGPRGCGRLQFHWRFWRKPVPSLG